jgi:hypothetical protein
MRLALREEGTMWNAYVAQTGTMEGAFIIGSITMKAAAEHPEIKEGFMELMKQVINVAITDILGAPPDAWHDPVSAPESERSGHS